MSQSEHDVFHSKQSESVGIAGIGGMKDTAALGTESSTAGAILSTIQYSLPKTIPVVEPFGNGVAFIWPFIFKIVSLCRSGPTRCRGVASSAVADQVAQLLPTILYLTDRLCSHPPPVV
jgi:hypothetical protein